MHFPLLEPLISTAEPWGLEEPSLRNTGLTYFMLPESLYFTSKNFHAFYVTLCLLLKLHSPLTTQVFHTEKGY
jgi:hypothetical protein